MQKIHIVSNRLPFSVKEEGENTTLEASVGGLATGMKSIYKDYGGTWIGWTGLDSDTLDADKQKKVDQLFKQEKCASVHLNSEEIQLFYEALVTEQYGLCFTTLHNTPISITKTGRPTKQLIRSLQMPLSIHLKTETLFGFMITSYYLFRK